MIFNLLIWRLRFYGTLTGKYHGTLANQPAQVADASDYAKSCLSLQAG
jgi:hypothetical protein